MKAYKNSSLGNLLDSPVKKAGIVSASIMREFFPKGTLWHLRFCKDKDLRDDLAAKIIELRNS